MKTFEEVVAGHNADIFTREFTYSSLRFKSQSGQELELCDGAVWIDDLLLLFQLKQRNLEHDTHSPEMEAKWFEKKIDKLAVGQFSDTLKYLKQEKTLPLMNHRGQVLDISTSSPSTTHLVVLFDSSEELPLETSLRKGRVSQRVGFVHYLHIHDYINICQALYTPFEIADYLDFRALFVQANAESHSVTEKALVGKYLSDTDSLNEISHDYECVVDRLIDDRDEFNVSKLMHVYLDRIVYGNEGTEYHAILANIAKLRRNMMREFRKRFEWAMAKCREPDISSPSRFYPVNIGCSFVAIPIPSTEREHWRRHLEPLTLLCKYDFKSQRCIGFTIAPDSGSSEHFVVNWMYIEFPWKQDAATDQLLAEHNPFRKCAEKQIGKYFFTQEKTSETN